MGMKKKLCVVLARDYRGAGWGNAQNAFILRIWTPEKKGPKFRNSIGLYLPMSMSAGFNMQNFHTALKRAERFGCVRKVVISLCSRNWQLGQRSGVLQITPPPLACAVDKSSPRQWRVSLRCQALNPKP